ncbi:DUF167 domain-containing protein [Novosphingobium sp.]|uniref:DUF167 domain-containing protein n=1 Tax=Novosphingobium sp. TaxID=1874826 RepID=UPI0025EB2C94|nr:DUF167 domain-containing protein [Novosphingobium sp.]
MARPPTDLPDAAQLRALIDDEGRLAVRVTPGARVESLTIDSGQAIAKVRAKPEDGKANAAVIALVARALDAAPSTITLLRGATSRQKLLRIG